MPLLVYPALDFSLNCASHCENADGPIVTGASLPTVNSTYCPDSRDLRSPLVALLLAASHAGLPPAFVAVAEHDPACDEGIACADALRGAGVAVWLDRGPGLIHSYLRALSYCPDVRRTFE